jgi:hypothetical protein
LYHRGFVDRPQDVTTSATTGFRVTCPPLVPQTIDAPQQMPCPRPRNSAQGRFLLFPIPAGPLLAPHRPRWSGVLAGTQTKPPINASANPGRSRDPKKSCHFEQTQCEWRNLLHVLDISPGVQCRGGCILLASNSNPREQQPGF